MFEHRTLDPKGAALALLLSERIVYIAKTVRRVDPVRLMLCQSVIGSVGFLLISLAAESGGPPAGPPPSSCRSSS